MNIKAEWLIYEVCFTDGPETEENIKNKKPVTMFFRRTWMTNTEEEALEWIAEHGEYMASYEIKKEYFRLVGDCSQCKT